MLMHSWDYFHYDTTRVISMNPYVLMSDQLEHLGLLLSHLGQLHLLMSMLAAIKMEAMIPSTDSPDEGCLAIEFHMPQVCSPLVRPGRPTEEAPVIAKPSSDVILRNAAFYGFRSLHKVHHLLMLTDVHLVCLNAMQYNATETVYFKQANSIQELARMKFQSFRIDSEHTKADAKSEQKTECNSLVKKPEKNSTCTSFQEPVGSDFFSEKDVPTKLGKPLVVIDENRLKTDTISSEPVVDTEYIFTPFEGETKQLVDVVLHEDHSNARSLTRFATDLGPFAWKVASMRIEQALPTWMNFGCGWIGEYEPLPKPVQRNHKLQFQQR